MHRSVVDRIGAVASAVCVVHCVLTGMALGLLSYAGFGFLGSVVADLIFLGVAIAIAIVAIVHGIKRHHSYKPALVFALGLCFIVMGHFVLNHRHETRNAHLDLIDVASTAFSVLGGLSLVAFHVLNNRLQRKCSCRHCRTGH